MRKKFLYGIWLAIFGAFCWGISGIITEILLRDKNLSMDWLMSFKLLISGIAILAITFFTKEKKNIFNVWKNKNDILRLFIFSIFGVSAMQYTYLMSVKTSNAAIATVLIFISPIIIVIYTSIKKKKIPLINEQISIFLAILGTIFLVTKGNFTTLAITPIAFIWGILAALANTVYLIQPVSLLKKYGTLPIVGWAILISSFFFNLYHPFWQVKFNFNKDDIWLIFFIIIFGTLIGTLVYLSSLKYISPTISSLLSAVEPLSVTIISIIFLHDFFNIWELSGIILIISTVFILTQEKKEK